MSDKLKKRRFEGFIHQKIDPNLQKALTFLAQKWNVPESDVPQRAIYDVSTRDALVAATGNAPKKSRRAGVPAAPDAGKHAREVERLEQRLREVEAERNESLERLARVRKVTHRLSEIEDATKELRRVLEE